MPELTGQSPISNFISQMENQQPGLTWDMKFDWNADVAARIPVNGYCFINEAKWESVDRPPCRG